MELRTVKKTEVLPLPHRDLHRRTVLERVNELQRRADELQLALEEFKLSVGSGMKETDEKLERIVRSIEEGKIPPETFVELKMVMAKLTENTRILHRVQDQVGQWKTTIRVIRWGLASFTAAIVFTVTQWHSLIKIFKD